MIDKKKIAFACAGAFVVALGARHFMRGDDAEIAARDPKQILGRVWFDHLPKNRSDDVTIAVFFGGGIGVYDKGSAWRSTIGGLGVSPRNSSGGRTSST